MKTRNRKKASPLPKPRTRSRIPRLPKYDATAKPVWEVLVELGASVPESEWEKVPTDLSINFHHYHHGAPKETE